MEIGSKSKSKRGERERERERGCVCARKQEIRNHVTRSLLC